MRFLMNAGAFVALAIVWSHGGIATSVKMIADPDEIGAAAAKYARSPAMSASEALPSISSGDFDAIASSVVTSREKAETAASDPTAAFEAFMTQQAARATTLFASSASLGDAPPSTPNIDLALALAMEAQSNPAVFAERKAIFDNNLKKISDLNAYAAKASPTGYPTLSFGVTPFAHLTSEEFVDAYLKVEPGGRTDETSYIYSYSEPRVSGRRRRKQNGHRNLQASHVTNVVGTSPALRKLLVDVGGFPLTCANLPSQTTEVPNPFAKLPYKEDKFDWRNVDGKNLVTPVRDQNVPEKCRTFETFAAVAAIESVMLRDNPDLRRETLDISEQDFNDCWYNDQCKQASYAEIFFDRVTCEGVAFESQVPYTGADIPGTKNCKETLERYDTGIRAWSYVVGSEVKMAQALNYAPITNELRVNSWMLQFYDAGVFDCMYTRPPPFPQPGNNTDVAIYFAATTLVAFENSVVVTPVNQTNQVKWNVWAGKMSLGQGWGDNGYIRLRKDCSGEGAMGALNMYTSLAKYRVVPVLEKQLPPPDPCDKDTEKPIVEAKRLCIQPLNGNTFGKTMKCFEQTDLASGTDNCGKVRYNIDRCRNVRPIITDISVDADPCFFGPVLACIDISKAPAPPNLDEPRLLQVRLTARDSSRNRVSLTSDIEIYYKPKEGCMFL